VKDNTTRIECAKALGYEIYKMDPERAIRVLTRLIKMGGPSLSKIFSNEGNLENVLDSDIETLIGPMIAGLAENLDEDIAWRTIEDLLTCVRKNGMEISVPVEFMGKTKTLLLVCKEAIKYNYADFLSGSKTKGSETPN
jgi:hypothetical protein